jgi:hypothetical protein
VCVLEVTAARHEPETGFYGHDDGHSGSIKQKQKKVEKANSNQRFMVDASPCGYSYCLNSKPSAVKFTLVFLYLLFCPGPTCSL